jgi:LacI family transcriptional regulator
MSDVTGPEDGFPSPRSTSARSKIRDIARLAGVHESTVSRALNPVSSRPVARATVERIARIAEEVGYRPNLLAMGLRRGRSQTIGLVVPDITDAYNGYVIRGIQDEAEKRDMSVLIMEDRHDRDKRSRTLELMVSRQVEALIVMTAREGDEQIFERVAAEVPIVFCLQHLPRSPIPSVTTDDRRGGELAAGYLAQLGHRTVAQLTCDLGVECFRERRDGFIQRANDLGLEIIDFPHSAAAPNFDDGRDLAALFLASTPTLPTGIFVHTDLMAIGAIRAFDSAGIRCPEDVSVVSFDASVLGKYFNPSLTSIGVAAYDIGRKTGELALDAAEGAAVHSHVFPPAIMHGTSATAAASRRV